MSKFDGLCDRIKMRRKQLGMSPQQLADGMGKAKTYVWQLENKKHSNPSVKLILNLATVLRTTPDFLLGTHTSNFDFTPDEVELVLSHRRIFSRTQPKLTTGLGEWRIIESAPEVEGQLALVFGRYGPSTAQFYDGRWHVHGWLDKDAMPTHWQPLPEPPKETDTEAPNV